MSAPFQLMHDPESAQILQFKARRGRIDLRRRFRRLTPQQLESRAARFLTLAAEYAKRRQFERDMAHPPANRYPGWTYYRASSWLPERHFPSGDDVTAYVQAFDRLNTLTPVPPPPPPKVERADLRVIEIQQLTEYDCITRHVTAKLSKRIRCF